MQKQKFRLRNNLVLNILFSFSSITLALFGFLAVLPPASEPEASAIIDGEQFALTVTNSDSLSLEIDPTDSGAIAIAKDTIVANTNSPAGYKLYVSTDSESNAIHLNGKESNNTEDKKLSPTAGTSELPSQLENNSWGFAIAGAGNFDTAYNTENPSTTSKFAAVPQKDAEQLIHDHSGRATDDETEIYFAAKANTNIASGNYQTTILYTTLSEATDQDTTEINLENTVFPTNYETTGSKTVVMNTSILSSKIPTVTVKIGTIQAENVNITNNAPLSLTFDLPAGLAEGPHDVTLYITNLAKSYTKQNAIGIYKPMQEMTPELCESMTLEEQKQFIDTRDNKLYFAAKLKDGNCWMTQNLDLDLSTTTTLTPADSDVTANWTPSRATIAGAANLNSTNWADIYNNPYSFDPGNYYFDGTYYRSATCNYLTTTCDHFATTPYTLNGEHGHVGNYYNWSAAVASNDTSATTAAGTDMSSSICPAGWRLPHGHQSAQGNDFATLNTAYGGATNSDSVLLANPLFFVRGGDVNSGSLYNSADYGRYWSSTANSAAYADALYFYSGLVNLPGINFGRNRGFSVRCLARKQTKTLTIKNQADDSAIATYDFETSYKLPEAPVKEGYNFLGYDENKTTTTPTYHPGDLIDQPKTLYAIYKRPIFNMQEVSTWKNYLNVGEQVQAKDVRDNKIYWVSKLKDGNVWMTQNLDYDLNVVANRTLTTATSNVATTRTVTPASWGEDDNAIYFAEGGDYYYMNGTTRTAGYSSLPADSVNRHYAQGDFYSWRAATAGQGTTSVVNADVNESICPKGWRLPTSNSDSANYSYGNMIKRYGYTGLNQSGVSDATLLASPIFFTRGGDVYKGSLADTNSNGYYWTSRAYSSNTHAYYMRYGSDAVDPNHTYNRNLGRNVRCVAL